MADLLPEKAVPQLMPIIEVLDDKVRRKYHNQAVYIIDGEERVHMAHIDIHYSSSVNGVASLHTEILKTMSCIIFMKFIQRSLIIRQMVLLLEDGCCTAIHS